MNELKYWVAFHQISGIGPATFAKLEARFGNLESAWRAPVSDLIAAGVRPKAAAETDRFRDANEPDEVMGLLDRLDMRAIHLRHPEYPARLAETPLAPSVIYLRGRMLAADEHAIAIVGSRDATPYGFEMTRRLSYDLARAGVTIVSGLARGIDSASHKAALEAGGRTIAVLGSGLDRIYPQRSVPIAEKIVRDGALLTEYPPGVSALPQHFPRRNRVISGLCHGVLVVEAAFKSGAMLTVSWALEQNRDVFAVPGSALSEKSKGTNWLIQQGAKLTVSVDDILEELNIDAKPLGKQASEATAPAASAMPRADENLTDAGNKALDNLARDNNGLNVEQRVLGLLENAEGPMHVDDITRALGVAAAAVSSVLSMLELRGSARQVGTMLFTVDKERPVISK
ncbi:MAG: DNA-processing protein DprA [Chloroflexi bacterium]|nr:DNA-processing protein DprA [Chloroflexota bacterium]